MGKKLSILLPVIFLLFLFGCSAGDPLTEDVYVQGSLYVWDGAAWRNVNAAVAGVGDVTGPAGATDEAVARYDGVTGQVIQNSLATLSDAGTLYAPVMQAGNMDSAGKVEADRLIGDVEGYSIDVVQASDLNIALNDTLDVSFLFVPDVIVIDYTGRCQHDVTLDDGHTTGHSVVIITGVDAMACNTNYTALYNNGGAFGSHAGQNDAVNTVVVYGGNDGLDDSYFYGVGSWTTATKTLRLTFSTVANTNAATNFIELIAVAYR